MFGKTREGFYCIKPEEYARRELLDFSIIKIVQEYRENVPSIGGYKLFVILKSIYPDIMIGRDKFYRLLSRKHLMLRPLKRRHTTSSNHNYRKYSNLIKGFVPDAPNQLWVSDITYVDTDAGVCCLHLITDAFTRKITGWVVSDSLMASASLNALNQAIDSAEGYDLSNLIHHSDRGSQYCCNMYIERLNEIKARISMTEDYSPTDNAIAERVNGIIKQEWLYKMKRPRNTSEAQSVIGNIVDFYNNKRPHMSIGMMTPAAKEKQFRECSWEAWRLQPQGKPLQCFS